MKCKRAYHLCIGLVPKGILLKLFSDMVTRSFADNVTTGDSRIVPWRTKMPVKDWLFINPQAISEIGSDLEIT